MAIMLEHPESADAGAPSDELSSRAAAEAFVGGVCFKLGPPTLVGAELEWLTAQDDPSGARPSAATLATALGPHAPRSIAPHSPELPLPGGSRVTLEPGGQIELSSAAVPTTADLCARLESDTRLLRDLLAAHSVRMICAAADAHRPPRRLLTLPRYRAMEACFDGFGPFGRLMMCNTAATQVSVDAGTDRADVAARWTALHVVGPALVAAFACSPSLAGAPTGAWSSQRMRTWLRLDNARTRPPAESWEDPIAAYGSWALDVPLLCVRRPDDAAVDWTPPPCATFADWLSGALDDEVGRRPGTADLAYHLTTLFPPVRASGHLEVRYIDAQPESGWATPVHTVDALLSTPRVRAEATALADPVSGRWLEAARYGLDDPQIRSVAADLLALAAAHASTGSAAAQLDDASRRCRDGRAPTETRP